MMTMLFFHFDNHFYIWALPEYLLSRDSWRPGNQHLHGIKIAQIRMPKNPQCGAPNSTIIRVYGSPNTS